MKCKPINSLLCFGMVFILCWSTTTSASDANQQQSGPILFATVGGDGACDFNSGDNKIQDAIDSVENYAEIRVASNISYTENLSISDRNINIRGGFADCTAASQDTQNSSVYSLINGDLSSNVAVISILGDGQRSSMLLENLEIKDGTGSGLLSGGIATFRADLDLKLNRIRINNNTSSNLAGGLSIYTDGAFLGSNTDVEATDVFIANNTGFKGGGVYCGGVANRITIDGISGIALNQAIANGFDPGHGGGVFLERSCYFTNYSGRESGNINTLFNGIILNDANGNGGGLYLQEEATADLYGGVLCFEGSCSGSHLSPANVTGNTAGVDGGGIYVTGFTTTARIKNGLINNNEAGRNGGGLFVADRGGIEMYHGGYSDFSKQCWNPGKCSQLTDNKAGNYGGGSYAETAGISSITRTFVTSNRADFGTAAYVRDEDSKNIFTSSMVFNNGNFADGGYDDIYVFRTLDAGSALGFAKPGIRLIQTTVAENRVIGSILGNSNGHFIVWNSIISNAPTQLYSEFGVDPFIHFDCNVAHEIPTINIGSNENMLVADPFFVDRANGDFHLDAEFSPAVDLCEIVIANTSYDIDLDQYNYDDPFVVNGSQEGAFDAGADETLTSDIIFVDGF